MEFVKIAFFVEAHTYITLQVMGCVKIAFYSMETYTDLHVMKIHHKSFVNIDRFSFFMIAFCIISFRLFFHLSSTKVNITKKKNIFNIFLSLLITTSFSQTCLLEKYWLFFSKMIFLDDDEVNFEFTKKTLR